MSHQYLKPAGKAKFQDMGITRFSEILQQWNGETGIEGIGIVGAPLSKSSISHSGAAFAPEVIRRCLSYFTTYSIEDEIDLKNERILDLGDILMHVTDIPASQQRIEEALTEVFTQNPHLLPIVLGGDHSISCPSIKAFAKLHSKIGVIQFDAHHDLREIKNEHGGPSNGTPFRGLLESGTLLGENLVQIGIRNYSNGQIYHQYAKENDLLIYSMKDVREREIEEILAESIEHLSKRVDAIYLSVDMDVLDQAFAPGCPAIGPGGMHTDQLISAIRLLAQQPLVKAMDIVEIDPTIDFREMTSRVAASLLVHFVTGKTILKN